MPLCADIQLFWPVYHGLDDKGEPHFPPSPVRLLSALTSGAHALMDEATKALALRAISKVTAAPPPIIVTPKFVNLNVPRTYSGRTWLPEQVSSSNDEKLSKYLDISVLALDTGNRELKPQGALALSGRRISFQIDTELTAIELEALELAATNVAYFGRSNDAAILSVRSTSSVEDGAAASITWYPSLDSRGTTRGWQSNTIAWLNENHRRIFSDDMVTNKLSPLPSAGYVAQLSYHRSKPVAKSMDVIELPSPIDQNRAPELFRRVRAVLPDNWRAAPLTRSLHPKSDGKLVGIGLFSAPGAKTESPIARVRDEVGEQLSPRTRNLMALDSATWTTKSSHWISTTPMRSYRDRRLLIWSLEREILETLGVSVTVLRAERVPYRHADRPWSNWSYTDGYVQWWIKLGFAEPVDGPLIVGNSTGDGFGMFKPLGVES